MHTQRLGPEAAATIDTAATARWLGEAFGVPAKLIRAEAAVPPLPVPVPAPVPMVGEVAHG